MFALYFTPLFHLRWGIAGFSDGPGQISVPERPAYLVGQGPNVLAVGANGVLWIFFSLIWHYTTFLSPSFWKTTLYMLNYCLNGR